MAILWAARNRTFRLAFFLFCLTLAFLIIPSEDQLYTLPSCDPIKSENDQYSVKLDGVAYPQYVPLYFNRSIDFKCLNSNRKTKLILLWTQFYGDDSFYYTLGKRDPFIRNSCPVTNCELTNDRSRVKEADLVVVNVLDRIDAPLNVTNRPAHQKWVFSMIESPINHSPPWDTFENVFNLSSTYMHTSDFDNSYEYQANFYWRENATFDVNRDFHGEKVGFAAALISNCFPVSRRMDYIKELQKHVPVVVYGRCGNICPNSFWRSNRTGECREIIGTEYKFYLAFENSICQEYITEKFFKILNYNTIPVVMGGGDYTRFVPKSGYIDVRDYKTPLHLARYMLYLNRNKTAYNSYFKWKRHISFHNLKSDYPPLCSMCIKLQLEAFKGVEKKVLNNLQSFWDKKHCKMVNMQPNNGSVIFSFV